MPAKLLWILEISSITLLALSWYQPHPHWMDYFGLIGLIGLSIISITLVWRATTSRKEVVKDE